MADYKTYACIILSNSIALSELIDRYSEPRQAPKSQYGIANILSPEQINTALANPLQSIQVGINSYIAGLRAHVEAVNTEDLIADGLGNLTQDLKLIREKYSNDKNTTDAIHKLEEVFKSLKASETEFKELNHSLQENDQKMDALIRQQDQEWQDLRTKVLNEINQLLQKNGWQLGDFELQELLSIPANHSPWKELLNRYQELNLEPPKGININKPDANAYFMLKGYLAAYQYHKKQLIGSGESDVTKTIKKILPKSINEGVKTLAKKHATEMREIGKLNAKLKKKISEIYKKSTKTLKIRTRLVREFPLIETSVFEPEAEKENIKPKF